MLWRCTATVNIGFLDEKGALDETQFDVGLDELMELFADFCEENGFDESSLTYVDIVGVEMERSK